MLCPLADETAVPADHRKKLDIKWTCEMRFEKHLTRELLASMRDAGCLKIVFGLESFNQRVMDFMKKGIKQEWVRRIAG